MFKLPQFIPAQLGTPVATYIPEGADAKCILVLVLFDLIEGLQAKDACMDDIRMIQKATEAKAMDGARKLAKRQGSDSRTRQQMQLSGLRYEIKWPLGA